MFVYFSEMLTKKKKQSFCPVKSVFVPTNSKKKIKLILLICCCFWSNIYELIVLHTKIHQKIV